MAPDNSPAPAHSAPLDVLILAGSRAGPRDPLAVAGGVSHKALLSVGGVPMILRVLDAVRATPGLGRIFVCIEDPGVLAPLGDLGVEFIAAGTGPANSVGCALQALGGGPLLVTTADHALLRPEWISTFLERAGTTCDVAAAIATEDAILRDVPCTKRTMIRFADGAFSGCNMFLFRTPASLAVAEFWEHMERERKHPVHMARLLGIGMLVRYFLGRMNRPALYTRILQLTGARARLITLPDGRAAVDVDKTADLELVNQLLAGEQHGARTTPNAS